MDIEILESLLAKQKTLMGNMPHKHEIPDHAVGSVVAGMGMIEEVMEYLGAIGFKSWRPQPLSKERRLEEITDMLFFMLEMVIFSGFTWKEILEEYDRKWEENNERYRRSKVGDFGWDKRAETKGL